MNGVPNEILLEAFKSRLREGRFFDDWKKQSLVLPRKGNKPLKEASSYKSVCLLDTTGKVLEELILQRLQSPLVGENSVSENHFGFRKGRSAVDAIQDAVDIATNARRGTRERKGFCGLISIDKRNAFNTARWKICIEAMVHMRIPDYLLRMIDDYLSNRWVVYEGDKWPLKEEMTCGAPQRSREGLFVSNVMYDDFLHLELPTGMSIIGFADDALIVCAAEDVRMLELKINESL